MNSNRDYPDAYACSDAYDCDGHDEPRGTDPKLRRDNGQLWMNYNGSWFQVSNNASLPRVVRDAWMAEEMRRDRIEKEAP